MRTPLSVQRVRNKLANKLPITVMSSFEESVDLMKLSDVVNDKIASLIGASGKI